MVFFLESPTAQAQQCSVDRPSNPKVPWSYRLIDGRKCWYEGENGLSKSLLQWPAQAPISAATSRQLQSAPHSTHLMRPPPQPRSSTSETNSVSPLSPPSAEPVSSEPPVRVLTVK